MGIYTGAIYIGLFILAAAIAFALIPEILERLPRRRRRREDYVLRPSAEEARPRRKRPPNMREAPAEEPEPPSSPAP